MWSFPPGAPTTTNPEKRSLEDAGVALDIARRRDRVPIRLENAPNPTRPAAWPVISVENARSVVTEIGRNAAVARVWETIAATRGERGIDRHRRISHASFNSFRVDLVRPPFFQGMNADCSSTAQAETRLSTQPQQPQPGNPVSEASPPSGLDFFAPTPPISWASITANQPIHDQVSRPAELGVIPNSSYNHKEFNLLGNMQKDVFDFSNPDFDWYVIPLVRFQQTVTDYLHIGSTALQ